MALENNLVVDSDAELKAFLSSILSSEGIVVNINRTFIAYNNGTNRNRVFARCANRMAQKGTDEKFVVIALMCYPALNWILKARDIDAMIEQFIQYHRPAYGFDYPAQSAWVCWLRSGSSLSSRLRQLLALRSALEPVPVPFLQSRKPESTARY